jgi:hypothetical protein
MNSEHLLTSVQMADFVADGLLRFDDLVPDTINREAMRETDEQRIRLGYEQQGQPLENLWRDSPGFGAMFRLPQVQGIIRSLLGPDPLYDHHAFHRVGPGHLEGQTWHADAIIDTRLHFDIQLFYYPHDTPREMGGTMFLPSDPRDGHRPLPELRGADADRLPGGDAGCGPSRPLALRAAQPHGAHALHVQAAPQSHRPPTAAVEHG